MLGKTGKPIVSVVPTSEQRREVDETPTGEGMIVPIGPATHEKAPYSQHDPMFSSLRVALAIGAIFEQVVPNIPRSWVVWVNRNSAAGFLLQVTAGSFDVVLAPGDRVTFPGRVNRVRLAGTVAAGDVTIVALGDDLLRF